jgi:four helix bundle protein
MDMVILVYEATATFPRNEQFSLTDQMRRAAISVPSNIAEGHSLKQTPNFIRHLSIACGSLAELETQVEIARRLTYLPDDAKLLHDQISEVGRMLTSMRTNLRARL